MVVSPIVAVGFVASSSQTRLPLLIATTDSRLQFDQSMHLQRAQVVRSPFPGLDYTVPTDTWISPRAFASLFIPPIIRLFSFVE